MLVLYAGYPVALETLRVANQAWPGRPRATREGGQAAWRRRHPTPVPTLPARPPRTAIVYECPNCEARLLGEQRCPDCQVFCRRVGPGGPCPHCDEPVAVADLLDLNAGGA